MQPPGAKNRSEESPGNTEQRTCENTSEVRVSESKWVTENNRLIHVRPR